MEIANMGLENSNKTFQHTRILKMNSAHLLYFSQLEKNYLSNNKTRADKNIMISQYL